MTPEQKAAVRHVLERIAYETSQQDLEVIDDWLEDIEEAMRQAGPRHGEQDAPRWAHKLLDAFLAGGALDFNGEIPPLDIQARLTAWKAAEDRRQARCVLCGSQRYRHRHSTRGAGHPFMEA